MTSTSSDGSSVITLQFNLSLNIDVAEQEVQQSINAAGTYLPSDLPMPPHLQQDQSRRHADSDPGADSPTPCRFRRWRTWRIRAWRPRFRSCRASGLVSISGGQKPAVRIQANPTALASYGLNLEDVRSAIMAANVNQAKGNFDGPHQAYQIGANDQLLSSADYRAADRGLPQRRAGEADRRGHRDQDDVENVRQAAWMNETPAVIVNIQRQPGANIIAVVDRIKTLLPQLTATLPTDRQGRRS